MKRSCARFLTKLTFNQIFIPIYTFSATSIASSDWPYQNWRLSLLFLPSRVLEFSSVLHVTLIVLQRWITIRKPFSKAKHRTNLWGFLILFIWIICIIFRTTPLIALALKMRDFYVVIRLFNLHCFGTFPVIAITCMYDMIVRTVKMKKCQDKSNLTSPETDSEIVNARSQRTALIVRRLVIVLLICYLPDVAWKTYFYGVIIQRPSYQPLLEVRYFVFQICYHNLYRKYSECFFIS